MEQDVFKIFKDVELKAVGLDPQTQKMQEGYFSAFRQIGLPIHHDDYANPYSPLGGNLKKNIPQSDPVDPSDTAPRTGSSGLDPNKAWVADIAQSQQAYLNAFMLADDKLRMSNDYAVIPGASKLSDSWFAIINGANGIPPTTELNDEMKAAYEKATAVLMDDEGEVTPKYQAYMQYEEEYESKVKQRNKAYADAFTDPMKLQMWPVNGVVYQDDVDEAWDRWVALGHKEKIEKAINTLAAQGTDPAIALITRAKKKYQNSLLQFEGVGEIPYTLFSPHSWYDDADDGWTQYSSHDTHSESHYSSSSTAYGGSAGINLGLWSASAGFQHSAIDITTNLQMQNLRISFSYCVVDIKRPWLDTSLLNLKNWFLVGDYKKGCISNGTMGQELPSANEHAFLPSVVTSLILVKDVSIYWDTWKQDWAQHMSATTGQASAGVLCFTAKANYSHRSKQRDFTFDDAGAELKIPGIQLLGYVSTILPTSPQLDSADYMQSVKKAA